MQQQFVSSNPLTKLNIIPQGLPYYYIQIGILIDILCRQLKLLLQNHKTYKNYLYSIPISHSIHLSSEIG